MWVPSRLRWLKRTPDKAAKSKPPPAQIRLLISTAALISACLAGSVIGLRQLRADAADDARQNTHALGVVVARETARSVQAVSLVLKEVEHEAQTEEIRTPDGFRDLFSSRREFQDLSARLRDLPQADSLNIVGADGKLINFTRFWPPPDLGVADRDYFIHCQSSPGQSSPAEGTYISAPVINRGSGTEVFYIARCIHGAGGAFLGVLMSSLQTRYFQDFYASIGLQPGTGVTLRRTDGTLLISYRAHQGNFASASAPGPQWKDLVARGRGEYWKASTADAPARIVSVNRLDEFPIVVDVSLTEDVAFARWRRQALTAGLVGLSTLGCIFILLRALQTQVHRLKTSGESLRHRNRLLRATASALKESQAQLSRQSSALETTLEHMDQGLMMVTGERVVAVCNRRAMEMLDLPPALMLARPLFSDVLAEQWKHEEFTSTDDQIKEFVRKGGILDQPHSYERRRPNGRWIQINSVPLATGGVVRTYTDTTERKRGEETLAFRAHHDELTKLANRVLFYDKVEHAIAAAQRDGSSFAIEYLDLDRFKLVNDTRGHAVGDKLLVEVADRMRACVRPIDTVARLGGDEFAILLPSGAGQEFARAFANRLRQRLGEPYAIDSGICHIGASIGIAVYPADGQDLDTLMRAADGALYRAKGAGRGTIRCHEPGAEGEDLDGRLLEEDLLRALELDQFELCYQPIFNPVSGVPYSFEALLRWRHPSRGLLQPGAFIAMAEAIGAIVPIGRWVMQTACREAATWAFPVRLAINLSPRQFQEPDLERQLLDILARTGFPPDRLDIEVTEGTLVSDTGPLRATMHALRKHNIRLALDDFGTAYASLSKLQGFPFQQIKIDRSFVSGINEDESSLAILQAVFNMAMAMRLEVVVEGVETRGQLDLLSRLGSHYVQGYLLGRPQSPEWTREYLWQWNTNRAEAPPGAILSG